MKIMHVLWGLRFGGAETMLVDIVNRQCSDNDVQVLLINNVIDDALLDRIDVRVRVVRLDRPSGSRNPFYLLRLNYLIATARADIIHFHQDDIIRYLPARHLKKNLCLTVHCMHSDIPDVKKYNYLFAISDAVQAEIKKNTGKDAFLIYNGIDVAAFTKRTGYQPGQPFRIVQIGRLDHQHKGQDLALRAIHQLVYDHRVTNIHLDLIGGGPSLDYLQQLVAELKIEDYVTTGMTRSPEYIKAHLAEYDLLIQPSRWEGFGITIIEAMSAGVPTLISNVDGMRTVSQDGRYSYTFESGEVDDLTDKLRQIIAMPPDELEAKARQALAYVEIEFAISRTVKRYRDAYMQIIRSIR